MKKYIGLFCLTLLFACTSNADTTTGFIVDCQKLDTLFTIGKRAAKFDRMIGDYQFDANLVNLEKYGFPITISMPKDKRLEYITNADIKIRFVPKGSSSDLSSDSILKIHPFNIKLSARKGLKKILTKSSFEKYKDISVFDFLSNSLGKEKGEFNCDSQARAIGMFISSYILPYNNDGVFVYNIPKSNALLLVPKTMQFGLIQFIYSTDIDTLTYISIEGTPKALANYLRLLQKLP